MVTFVEISEKGELLHIWDERKTDFENE